MRREGMVMFECVFRGEMCLRGKYYGVCVCVCVCLNEKEMLICE